MATSRTRIRARIPVLCLLAAAAAAGVARPGPAQETPPPERGTPPAAPAPPGRIGVFVQSACPVLVEDCDGPLVVSGLVRDGPAARAGVQAGDTLLRVAGAPTTTSAGREAMTALRVGVPVELQIGSAAGRRSVRVVPELPRPEGFVRVFTPPAAPGRKAGEVRVLRVPEQLAALEKLQVRLDSIQGEIRPLVLFGRDSEGAVRVQVVQEDAKEVVKELERQRRELERVWRSRERAAEGEAVPPAPEVTPKEMPGAPGIRVEVRAENGAPGSEATWTYIVESRDLARRLESVRDSSLRDARSRLDSLVRLHREIRVVPGDGAEPVVVTGAPAAPRTGSSVYRRVQPAPDAAPLLEESSRVAGAEFRRLTPELAEYFRGADHGLLVLRVLSDTPAARLGLRGGDVVLAADGRPLEDVEALRERFARSPRAPVELTWVRRGVEMRGRLGPD